MEDKIEGLGSQQSEISKKTNRRGFLKIISGAIAGGISAKLAGNTSPTTAEEPATFSERPGLHRVVVPGIVSEGTDFSPEDENLPPPENFPWTRNEILFSERAGFEELRNGESIGVWIDPSLTELEMEEVIGRWNKIGAQNGRNKPFFVPANEKDAKIRFTNSDKTWVEPAPSFVKPFETSEVHMESSGMGSRVAGHELGHAGFGFVDFIGPDIDTKGYVNPQKNYDPAKPIKNSIMNYEYWNSPIEDVYGIGDVNLLRVGGFLDVL